MCISDEALRQHRQEQRNDTPSEEIVCPSCGSTCYDYEQESWQECSVCCEKVCKECLDGEKDICTRCWCAGNQADMDNDEIWE